MSAAVTFRLERDQSARDSFGEYRYVIYKGDRVVARYWHDYRGDDHGIEFSSGENESCPVGRTIDFVEGGGPKPLTLTDKAIAYLNGKVS
jgi:hypothetical protein